MKKISFVLLLCGSFFIMLLFPSNVLHGSTSGLLLWFHTLLPSLLPFLIVSNLFIYSNAYRLLTNMCGPFLAKLFQVSYSGTFAIFMGFLCGYPMGAKTISDLRKKQHITKNEACYLLSFCNNSSPGFIMTYVVLHTLKIQSMMLGTILISFAVPIIMSFIFRKFYQIETNGKNESLSHDIHLDFQMIDHSIMDAFYNITKIGGYVILFSIVISILNNTVFAPLLPLLELTNGIQLLAQSHKPLCSIYPSIMALVSFGGLCSVAQTKSMLADTDISIFPYIIQKLITALVTSLFAILYMQFIHQ